MSEAEWEEARDRVTEINDTVRNAVTIATGAALSIHHLRDPTERPGKDPHCGRCGAAWPCDERKAIELALDVQP